MSSRASRVLALYRSALRQARSWPDASEADYIRAEAHTLFRRNMRLTDDRVIDECIFEVESRYRLTSVFKERCGAMSTNQEKHKAEESACQTIFATLPSAPSHPTARLQARARRTLPEPLPASVQFRARSRLQDQPGHESAQPRRSASLHAIILCGGAREEGRRLTRNRPHCEQPSLSCTYSRYLR